MPSSDDRLQSVAIVILAHRDAGQVRRLIAALPGAEVFVHCDLKAPDDVAREMVSGHGAARVTALPRRDVRLASWSLVSLELSALRTVLDATRAEHIAIMSGSDYPLVAPPVLNEALHSWRGLTWVRNVPLPYDRWDFRFAHDGGLWRWRWYFPTRRDHVFMHGSMPLTVPMRRRVPAQLRLRASPQWKVYARTDAERLLRVLGDHPELVRFARHTFTPEESFVSSVMASPEYFGDAALTASDAGPWLVNWGSGGGTRQHPGWLTEQDVPRLAEQVVGGRVEGRPWSAPVFARKFSLALSPGVLDAVEEQAWTAVRS